MPVDTKHPEVQARLPQWERCHDVIAGTDAVKTKGDRYLPRLGGLDYIKYEQYKERALFYGATARTVQGLLGAIFRITPVTDFPDTYSDQLNYFSVNGLSHIGFSSELTKEVLSVGRVGVLVDVPREENSRAFSAMYSAENVINWKTKRIGVADVLVLVVLQEKYNKTDDDPFSHENDIQYRELKLNFDSVEPYYSQDVWRKGENTDKFQIVPNLHVEPTRAGIRLNKIPFHIINTTDLTPKTTKPPLLDMADANLSHYITTANLEHGAHFTALPTIWLTGFPADTKLMVGAGVAWVANNENAKAGMLEFTGAGLSKLESILERKENYMAVLGARMLEQQKVGVESEGAMKMRSAGEGGALSVISKTVSEGMTEILKQMAWWSNASDSIIDKITFELNTDFNTMGLTPAELKELTVAWQSGAISQPTYLYNLKKGEILPDDISIEDEADLIDVENAAGTNDKDMGADPLKRNFELVKDPLTGDTTGIKEA